MMFIFYCLMPKTKRSSWQRICLRATLFLLGEHMHTNKKNIWFVAHSSFWSNHSSLQAFTWAEEKEKKKKRAIRPGEIQSSTTTNCTSSVKIPWERQFQLLLCCINRSSPSWGATGCFVSMKLVRATSDFRAETCVTAEKDRKDQRQNTYGQPRLW